MRKKSASDAGSPLLLQDSLFSSSSRTAPPLPFQSPSIASTDNRPLRQMSNYCPGRVGGLVADRCVAVLVVGEIRQRSHDGYQWRHTKNNENPVLPHSFGCRLSNTSQGKRVGIKWLCGDLCACIGSKEAWLVGCVSSSSLPIFVRTIPRRAPWSVFVCCALCLVRLMLPYKASIT